jgi:hypothetical protein
MKEEEAPVEGVAQGRRFKVCQSMVATTRVFKDFQTT